MIAKPNDALAPTLAKVWRKSWIRTLSRLARLLTRSQVLSIAALGLPAIVPAMTNSVPATRGRVSRISAAGGLRYTTFSRVLLSSRTSSRRSKSTDRQRNLTISPRRQPVSASRRIAAIACALPEHSASTSSDSASFLSSASERNRCILRTGGFLTPRAGLSERTPRSTANWSTVDANATHWAATPAPPVAMLPGRRFSCGATDVRPHLTSLSRRSMSARLIASARFLPNTGFRWSSMRPRSDRIVLAFLCATPWAT